MFDTQQISGIAEVVGQPNIWIVLLFKEEVVENLKRFL